MKISVLVHQTPSFASVAAITVPALQSYCDRHGYDLKTYFTEDRQPGGRPLGFLKTEAALRTLREVGDDGFLFVVDLDWLVTNHTIRLESFIDREHSLFITHDRNGLNSGAYLIRGDAGEILQNVLFRQGWAGVHGEQDAFASMLCDFPWMQNITRVLRQRSFNSYLYTEYPETRGADEEGHWQPGDFALHLPGRSNERRCEIFTSDAIQGGIV